MKNREVLFRGKRVDNGEWVYGDLVQWKSRDRSAIIPQEGDEWCTPDDFEIIPETVGQFTGLTDKNGTKIFEGDKTKNGETVVFYDGIFGTTYDGNTQGVYGLSEKRCKYIEITSNIHDNPTT